MSLMKMNLTNMTMTAICFAFAFRPPAWCVKVHEYIMSWRRYHYLLRRRGAAGCRCHWLSLSLLYFQVTAVSVSVRIKSKRSAVPVPSVASSGAVRSGDSSMADAVRAFNFDTRFPTPCQPTKKWPKCFFNCSESISRTEEPTFIIPVLLALPSVIFVRCLSLQLLL